ncbi:acyltransferase [Vibrio sp. UCD-FRSSP16_10]|uniref:acyltransferase family protein n=1 Tax=unclassified Vibrio TaxID=2614977 RepID=UPI0007FB8663|nr:MULTISPECIES: acyltransferase family protein [unclassified Vibrio]OBT12739.1 acyltransferase [Vibrio sp. UCD-FRSSP16_30]OBT18206.1 acyltransferase [Vibrio sp. UCD-FRSSP16_10]
MNFRYDINGLRAIAVIAVVLFHFNPAWVPGGFAGVDVFFVISGFLMTSIIFRGLENDNFSLFKFYVARANRIIPALAVLCLVLLVFGWFYLTPMDYRALGKHVASSMGFLSNIIYWRESGYFAAASHEKWLLHTWSLSVEWQFYIIYPIVLIALKKFLSITNIKRLLILGTLLGFALSVVATIKWPNPAYYLLPTRAWEMMFGGLAFLYPIALKSNHKKIAEYTGLALILLSYAFISSDIAWPGHWALVPVFGAYLIIIANRQDSFVTNNSVFQALGKWSYSIYLWHWPIVVYINSLSNTKNQELYGITISILLGFLSVHLIESIKFSSFSSWRKLMYVKPIWLILFIGGLSSFVFLSKGVLFHYPKSVQNITTQSLKEERWSQCHKGWDDKAPRCQYGNGEVGAIVIGDSHAEALIGMISRLYNERNKSVLDWTMSGCPTAKGVYRVEPKFSDGCGVFVERSLEEAKQKYQGVPIIIINRTAVAFYGQNEKDGINYPIKFIQDKDKTKSAMVDALVSTACEFTKHSPTFVVRPIPELKQDVPKTLMKNIMTTGKAGEIKLSFNEYLQRQNIVYQTQNTMAKKCGVTIIDPIPYLCDSNYCNGNIGDKSYYFDDDHLNKFGAELISGVFEKTLFYP